MPSSLHISSPVIPSPPNHKPLRNSKQDVAWQVQPITLSDAWHWEWIAFTHDAVSTPDIKLFFVFSSCIWKIIFSEPHPEFKCSFHGCKLILSVNDLENSPVRIYFIFSQTVSIAVIQNAKLFILPALLIKNWWEAEVSGSLGCSK